MAIDMRTLRAVSLGDPEDKITVKRAWLTEVHQLLEKAARDAAELKRIRESAHLEDQDDHATMDGVFGEGSAFERVFGKRRKG
jgi:hypothetical protein